MDDYRDAGQYDTPADISLAFIGKERDICFSFIHLYIPPVGLPTSGAALANIGIN